MESTTLWRQFLLSFLSSFSHSSSLIQSMHTERWYENVYYFASSSPSSPSPPSSSLFIYFTSRVCCVYAVLVLQLLAIPEWNVFSTATTLQQYSAMFVEWQQTKYERLYSKWNSPHRQRQIHKYSKWWFDWCSDFDVSIRKTNKNSHLIHIFIVRIGQICVVVLA